MRPIHLARLDQTRPAVILTRESVRARRSRVTVAPITSRVWGLSSEVAVGQANGLEHESVISCDNIVTISMHDLGRQVGFSTTTKSTSWPKRSSRRSIWTCRSPRPDYPGRVPKVFSNLNLNTGTPPRVQPNLGEWGPQLIPTTRSKKRMRIWVSLALFGALLACFLLSWYVYYLMTGNVGFGIGDQG